MINTKPTFYIKTLGCKTNQIESELMSQEMEGLNFEQSNEPRIADIFILNSCTVTSSTDDDALRILRKQKKENPKCICILTGCFAQVEGEKLLEYEFIDLVLGNTEKTEIAKHIGQLLNKNNISRPAFVKNIFEEKEFIFKEIINPSKTRAGLKIQDGCNNACSYCAIRLARGKSRSNPVNNIIRQVETYAQHGFSEIVLTGINIGQWGPDLSPSKTLFDLIDELDKTNIERFRLGSLNPNEISEKLLDRLAASPKFCPHFHLSLQSACDKILKNMNRTYSVSQYLAQIDMMNKKFDLPFIGSDIIVGFPGETDEDFEQTYKNIEKSGLTMAHVFPYSIRKNTPAGSMENQVSQTTKLERAAKLKTLVNDKYNTFIEKNIGKVRKAGIEKHKCKKTNLYKGLTENYLTVYIENALDDGSLCNTMRNCLITGFSQNKITAAIID